MSIDITKKMESEINRHKKVLEKYQLFSYSLFNNGEHYYHVRYARFQKATGFLILNSKSEAVELEEAKKIVRLFDKYNTCITSAANKIVYEKEKSVQVFKDLKILLQNPNVFSNLSISSVQNDIEKIILLADYYIQSQESARNIFEEMVKIDTKVQKEDKFLTMEQVYDVDTLVGEHNGLLYNQLRKSRSTIPSIRRVNDFCHKHSSQIDENNKGYSKKLIQLLSGFLDSNNINSLKKSLSDFEQDEYGRPIELSPGQQGLKELDQISLKYIDLNIYKIFNLLRNT